MMKKVLLGLAALSCVSLAAEGTNVYLKAGADMFQRFDEATFGKVKVNKDKADDFGYELTVEVMREVYPNLELGLGLSYQDHGDPKSKPYVAYKILGKRKYEMSGFKSVPLYATAKYNIPVEGNIKPYIGYSFNMDNVYIKIKGLDLGVTEDHILKVENGLYYGIGAGVEYNNFVIDLMYKVNKAEAKTSDSRSIYKDDLDYSRVTLSVGYKFNF